MPRARGTTTRRRIVTMVDVDTSYPFVGRRKTLWEHLGDLTMNMESEEAILFYEITNTSTASNRYFVPTNRNDLATYKKVAECYEVTKRYAQAGAILKTIIQSLPGRPFSFPSIHRTVPNEEEVNLSEDDLEIHDHAWYGLYRVYQKTNQFRDALYAVEHVRSEKYQAQKEDGIAKVLEQIKKPEEYQHTQPQPWRPHLPDENMETTGPSLLSIMSILKKGESAAVESYADRFVDPVVSKNVLYWLKSFEAAGKNDFVEAINCLKKMSHQNSRVLTQLAKYYYELDKRDEARRHLQTAHANDHLWIDGMDMLGFLCMGDISFYKDLLEEIVSTLQKEWPHRAETYTVAGFVAHQVHLDLACSLANRAMRCAAVGTDQYIYAAHLKVFCLRTLEVKTRDISNHDELHKLLNDVVAAMPRSPDLALLFVDTLLEDEDGHRQAKIFATKFLHDNQNNVHAKLLKVHVLVNGTTRNPEINHTAELFRLLEEITRDFPHIITGFTFLLNEYERLGNLSKCREIIEKLNAARPLFSKMKTPKFHRLKADYLLKFKEFVPAYHHLMAAVATGDVIDSGTMGTYESEIQMTGMVPGDYRNLEFLDPPISESARQSTSVSNSPRSATASPLTDNDTPGTSARP